MNKKIFYVGTTVIVGILILIFLIINIGEWRLEKGLKFYVLFDFANGILENGPVMVSGVKLGKVSGIEFVNIDNITKVKLEIWLKEKVKIKKNAKVYINQAGLMGEKYIEIDPGTKGNPNIKTEEVLIGEEPQKVEEVISGVVNVIEGLNKSIAGFNDVFVEKEVKKELRASITNISNAIKNVSIIVDENKTKLNNGFTDFQKSVELIKESAINVKKMLVVNEEKINSSINDIKYFSGNLNKLSSENYDSINNIIKNLNTASNEINKSLVDIGPHIKDFSKNINNVSIEINDMIKNKKLTIEKTIDNINAVTKTFSNIIIENEKEISNTLKNIDKLSNDFSKTLDLVNHSLTAVKEKKGLLGLIINDKDLAENASELAKDLSLTIRYLKHHPGILLNKNKYVSTEDYKELEEKLLEEEKKLEEELKK